MRFIFFSFIHSFIHILITKKTTWARKIEKQDERKDQLARDSIVFVETRLEIDRWRRRTKGEAHTHTYTKNNDDDDEGEDEDYDDDDDDDDDNCDLIHRGVDVRIVRVRMSILFFVSLFDSVEKHLPASPRLRSFDKSRKQIHIHTHTHIQIHTQIHIYIDNYERK